MNHPTQATDVSSGTPATNFDLATRIADFKLHESNRGVNYLSLVVLFLAGLYFVLDIYVDYVIENEEFTHLLMEGGIFLAISIALGYEFMRATLLTSRISASQVQISRLKKHLRDMIGDEFERWQLTPTERDIALLLIKGFSMREIAGLRHVKEKSVRQQATRIYTKAGVANRYELTSHFIEDLLAP